MFRLLVILHGKLNRWLFDNEASEYRDGNNANTYQSEATGRLGWGLIQYLAEYEEAWGAEVYSKATEIRLGWLAIGIGTEVGSDTPCFGSWIVMTFWKLGLILDFGQETRVGVVVLD